MHSIFAVEYFFCIKKSRITKSVSEILALWIQNILCLFYMQIKISTLQDRGALISKARKREKSANRVFFFAVVVSSRSGKRRIP